MLDTRLTGLTSFLQFHQHQRQQQQQQQLHHQQQMQQQQHHLNSLRAPVVLPQTLNQLKPVFPGLGTNTPPPRGHPLPLRLPLPLQPVPVSSTSSAGAPGPLGIPPSHQPLSPDGAAVAAALGFRANMTPSPGPGKFKYLPM